MKEFSIGKAYKQAFNMAIDNIGTIFLAYLALVLAGLLAMAAGVLLFKSYWLVLIILLISVAFSFMASVGTLQIGFDLIDRGASDWKRMFLVYKFFWAICFAGFFYMLMTFAGFLLLIIPGIIWLVEYSFIDLFIVDTDCSVSDSFTFSSALTAGQKVHLLFFIILNWVLMTASVNLLFPVVQFARISVYRQLKNSRS